MKIDTLLKKVSGICALCVTLLLAFLSQQKSYGQTTVFSDDFNRGSVVSPLSAGGTPSATYTTTTTATGTGAGAISNTALISGSDYAAQILASQAVTQQSATTITSGSTAVTLSATNASIAVNQYVVGAGIASGTIVSAISGNSLTLSIAATASGSTVPLSFGTLSTTQSVGITSISAPLSTYSSPFNTTLNANGGDVTWTFNMKTSRTTFPVSGFTAGNFAGGIILGSTSSTLPSAGNGYAVVIEKSITVTAAITSGSASVTLSAANTGIAVGQTVTGTGITTGTTVIAVSGTSFTLSANATATNSATILTFNNIIASANTTNTSTAVTLGAANANIVVGMLVAGTGIASGTTVTAISGTNVTLSAAATATGSSVSLTFGGGTTVKFIKFTGGLTSGTRTTLITPTLEFYNSATKNDWVSVKIVYTPSTNTWAMSLRDDGSSAPNSNFTTGLTSIGSIVDNSYTSGALSSFGFLWNHGSVSTYNTNGLLVDNYKVAVTGPTITPPSPATLSGFNYGFGSGPSGIQTFTTGGTSLTANITLTAPADFEINNPAVNGTYSSSLTLTQSGGIVVSTTINVRLKAGLAVASYTGETISITSTGATSQSVTLNGSVSSGPTILVSAVSLSQFANTNAGSNSTSGTFNVSGSNLSGNITVTAPANFQVSTDNTTFSSSVILTQSGGVVNSTAIYARYSPSGNGAYTGNITMTSTSTSTQNVSVSGYLATFYYKGTGSLAITSNWSGTSNGSGTSIPNDFVTDGVFYKILTSATSSAPWTVAGTGSKIIFGDPAVAGVTLTIASAGGITTTTPAVLDITAASSGVNNLVLQSTTAPTFGTINTASTVDLQATAAINTSPAGGFGNLSVSAGSPVFYAAITTVNGNLSISGTGTLVIDNPASRSMIIAGNLSLAGTGGVTGIGANTQTITLQLNGSGKTITNTAAGNNFQRINILLNIGSSYSLASDFDYTTSVSTRSFGGSGTLTIGSYTFTTGSGALTVATINTTVNSKVNVASTATTPITTGVTWNGVVKYTASGQKISAGTYHHLSLGTTSATLDSILGGTVFIVDTLTFSGSKALAPGYGTISYSAGATLVVNGTGSITLSATSPEWPVSNGPTNVTIVVNNLSFLASSNMTRTLPGNLRLTGNFNVNTGNTLNMGANSTIIKSGGNLSSGGGVVTYGSSASDVVNVNIEVTTANTFEISAVQSPGKVGTLTINPGVTYTFTGGREVINLANNGIVLLNPSGTLTFIINGNITGTGTITGNANASITYGGTSGTLNLTAGSQIAKTLTVDTGAVLTLGNPISVSGLALASGDLHAGTNMVTVSGNVSGTGTFTGTSKIYIAGSAVADTISGITASNLEIDNGYENLVNGPLTINGTLTLTSGKLNIAATNTLRLTSGNAIAGGPFSSSKYIIIGKSGASRGTVRMDNISTTSTLPIGTTTAYLPVTITPASASDFSVSAFDGITTDAQSNGTAFSAMQKQNVVDAVWDIVRNSGTGNATITFGWSPSTLEGSAFVGYTNSQIGIGAYNTTNSVWSIASGSGDNTANTATRTFTSFPADETSFAVGLANYCITGTPVVSNQTAAICNGDAFNVTPSGVPAGTTYSWSAPAYSSGSISGGSAQSGQSAISQTLSNSGTVAGTATYTVIPLTSAGCPGNTFTVTVTVNPEPSVSNKTTSSCSGSAFTVTPTGVPAGTTYTWGAPVYSGSLSGGSAQATGQSSISQTLSNSGTTSETATYTVTPLSGSCPGSTFTVTVTVNPVPVVNNETASICSGSAFAVTPAGVPAGTTYTWNAPTYSGSVSGGSAQPTGQSSISQTLTNGSNTMVGTATYVVTPASGSCPGNTFTVTVTVNPQLIPSVSIAITTGSNPTCQGGNITFTATPVNGGTAPTYQWYKNGVAVTGNTANTYTATNINASTPVYVVMTVGTGICVTTTTATSSTTTLTTKDNSWTGAVSTTWGTPANWCSGSVPGASTNIVIPTGLSRYPVLNNTYAVHDIEIQSGATVSLNDQQLTISGIIEGTGKFKGTPNSKLVISTPGAIGTLYMDPAANTLSSLKQTTALSTLTLGNPVGITGELNVGNTTLNTGGNLTLRSNVNGTAWVAPITGSGSITGSVTVERYMPYYGHRAWMMLAVPTGGSQTINAAWQEGAASGTSNPNPGYGTLLTKAAANPAAGYDATTAGNSLLILNTGVPNATGSWAGVTTSLLTTPVATTSGYMVYMRGDRSAPVTGGPVAQGPVTLRTSGSLYQGTQTAVPVSGSNNTLIGNIYASAVDYKNLVKTGLAGNFKLWDPKLGTIGGYQTFTDLGAGNPASYTPSPGGGSYGSTPNTRIESGQAFIVQGGGGGGSIQFTEAAKVSGSNNYVFRGQGSSSQYPGFKVNLEVSTASGFVLADGNSVYYNDAYSDAVNNDDAAKVPNFGENFGILKDGQVSQVETRRTMDSIVYQMTNLQQQQYRLQFIASGFETGAVSATLVDNFLHTATPVSLRDNDTINVLFKVTTDAGSSEADRFKVVFKNSHPVTDMNIQAAGKETTVQVAWTVNNEHNTRSYEVEHSANGIEFKTGGMVNAIANGSPVLTYNWLDENPVNGDNYYRVKAVSKSGESNYSSMVKVTIGKDKKGFAVYPNPVTGDRANIQFINQPAGRYTVNVINKAGQVLYTTVILHNGGTATQTVALSTAVTTGTYQVEVVDAAGEKNVQNLIVAK